MVEEALEEARDRSWACVVGAAVGDALGWALDAAVAHPLIHPRQRERSPVLRRFVSVEGRTGLAGDTTQLLLFTAEDVLRAHNRLVSQQPADPIASVHHAWLR